MAEPKKVSKKTTEKVFDITSPGKTVASANSKPMIVSNRAVVRDPMVTPLSGSENGDTSEASKAEPTAQSEATEAMPISKLRIEPLHTDVKAEVGTLVGGSPKAEDTPIHEAVVEAGEKEPDQKDEASKSTADSSDDELDEPGPDSKKAENKAAAAEAAAEQKRRDEAEAAIASKQYFIPINAVKKRRSARLFILVVIIILALAAIFTIGPGKDLLADSGLLGGVQQEDSTTTTRKPVSKQPATESAQKTEPESQPKAIIYSELKTVQSSDKNITIKVPVEYAELRNSRTVILHGQRKPDSTKDSYSSVGVTLNHPLSPSELQQVTSVATKELQSKGEISELIVSQLREGGMKEAELGMFTKHKNGIMADIVPSKDTLGNLGQGKVFVLFGSSTMYTIIIGADSAVWTANEAVFQQMIDSITIK